MLMLQLSWLWVIVTLVGSYLLVGRYIDYREQPKYLSVILVISLALPLSLIFLLPIDLLSTFSDKHSIDEFKSSPFYLERPIVNALWRINYWLTFFLTWVLLPLLQYWFDSGYYKLKDRFNESIRNLIRFQLLMLSCCVIGFGYIIFYHRSWLNATFLKGLVITISHIYSLTLALWLMAHGLIQLPRQTWENAGDYNAMLYSLYQRVPYLKEKMEDSKFELQDVSAKILSMASIDIPFDYRDWCIQLEKDIPFEFRPENQRYSYYANTEEPITAQDINRSTLHNLTFRLQRAKWSYKHNLVAFQQVVHKIMKLDTAMESENEQISDPTSFRGTTLFIATKAWSIILGALAIIIIESELFHGFNISIINIVVRNVTDSPENTSLVAVLASCVPFLTFMVFSALASLFKIKIFDIYHVISDQGSDPVSTTFFISYACRLTIPLSYNFLMLLDTDFARASSFQEFLGNSIKLISLGKILNDILPRLIVIPICLSLFHVWDKIKTKMKGNLLFDYLFDEFDFYEDEDEEEPDGGTDNSTGYSPRIRNGSIREAKQIVQEYIRNSRDLENSQYPGMPQSDFNTNIISTGPLQNAFHWIKNAANHVYSRLRSRQSNNYSSIANNVQTDDSRRISPDTEDSESSSSSLLT
ncbi:hypothetical protein HII12_002419 [Brettanomyces bruxellensis]|uniref:Uncharacterized protein n=1 Tax=Dekkera bruxellensis TaxID=5007 RepID=A0A8H6BII9_DEKBR|nr:hypothetical protein HII12_002419 [Brettanomyces bruxellensis]